MFVGCESGGQGSVDGNGPSPAPEHYRDFETADGLATYLRLDAVPLVGAHRGGATDQYPENALPTF